MLPIVSEARYPDRYGETRGAPLPETGRLGLVRRCPPVTLVPAPTNQHEPKNTVCPEQRRLEKRTSAESAV